MRHLALTDLGTCDATLTRDQALAAIGLGAITSDGDVEEGELAALVAALARADVLDNDDARHHLVLHVVGLSDEHGLGPLTGTALAVLEPDQREQALRLVFAVLMADGQVADAELEHARALQRALGVADDRYDALLAGA